MAEDSTYKLIEIVGTSDESFSSAVSNGIAKASKSLENLDWFEVSRFTGKVADGQVVQYQATMKVGFKIR